MNWSTVWSSMAHSSQLGWSPSHLWSFCQVPTPVHGCYCRLVFIGVRPCSSRKDSRLLATGATTGVVKPTAFRFSIAASGEDGVSSGCLRFAGFLGGTTCRAGISQSRGYFIWISSTVPVCLACSGPKSHLELVAVAVSGPSSCLFSSYFVL